MAPLTAATHSALGLAELARGASQEAANSFALAEELLCDGTLNIPSDPIGSACTSAVDRLFGL